jgi:formate hydrogenlyase subunit 3/multisubunit Na+/H+ antiporter MnhD subunit
VRVDALSAWFMLIVTILSFVSLWYGAQYLKAERLTVQQRRFHWILFIILVLSMYWVTMLQNAFAFLLVWEVMSLSSVLLVISKPDNIKALKATIHYLVQMHLSGVLLTTGFLWVYYLTGSFSFDALAEVLSQPGALWVVLVLALGFALKAEFVPFHGKVPNVYPFVYPHVAVLMSGAMVKLGIYGIVRIISYLQSDWLLVGEIILTVSVISAVYGGLMSAVHRDLRRLLAYCTIENVGVIGIGIGVGLVGRGCNMPLLYLLGFGGALLHVLNHALYKSLLFMAGGSVMQQTGTSNMDHLGGLAKQMPHTSLLFLIGALAVCGLPPLNGFVSEFIIYSGLVNGLNSSDLSQISLFVLCLGGLALVGGITLLTFTKSYSVVFLGNRRQLQQVDCQEVSIWLLVPQYLIVAGVLLIAVAPIWIIDKVNVVVSQALTMPMTISGGSDAGAFDFITTMSRYSLVVVLIVLIIWRLRSRVTKSKPAAQQPTWGCAWQQPTSRLQYSGKSFSKPLGKIFNFLIIEKKCYDEINKAEVFPDKRKYLTHYADFFEMHVIDRVTAFLLRLTDYLKFIQNGHIQSYVLYGIVFILAIFALTVFNLIQ